MKGKNSSRKSCGGIGPTRYFLTSFAIAVHDSTRYFWVVVKGYVEAIDGLTGVECGSCKFGLGGVLEDMTSRLRVGAWVEVATTRADFFSGSALLNSTRSRDQLQLLVSAQPSCGNTNPIRCRSRAGVPGQNVIRLFS